MPILFADDTSIVITDGSPGNINDKLNINLKLVHSWFKSNMLTINFFKNALYALQNKKQCIN
jgi:hypothetical protein